MPNQPHRPIAAGSSGLRVGVLCAASAYTIWGLLPLYLASVRSVSPPELLAHRIVWSLVLVLAMVTVRGRWAVLRSAFRSKAVMGGFMASAAMLSLNWFLFLWAISTRRNVDASLGYFINPLFSIALGALLLKEHVSSMRRLAVGWASLGVLWLILGFGEIPWIGLSLAASFGLYGLLRKTAALGALEGLAVEVLLLGPFALGYLGWLMAHGQSVFVNGEPGTRALLLVAGPMTTVPLLLFAAGARRIPLWLLGLLQYIGPTLQLLIGILVEHEAFGPTKFVGYALVWMAFLFASGESLWAAVAPRFRGYTSRRGEPRPEAAPPNSAAPT